MLALISLGAKASYADNASLYYQGVRSASWDGSTELCVTSNIPFNPSGMGNSEIYWDTTNAACITYMVAFGVALFAARLAMSNACVSGAQNAYVAASQAAGVVVSPTLAADVVAASGAAATYWSSQNYVSAAICSTSIISVGLVLAAALAQLKIIDDYANIAHKYGRVCGSTWNTWKQVDGTWMYGKYYDINAADYSSSGDCSNIYSDSCSSFQGSYQECLYNKMQCGTISKKISEQEYREYIYGGMEYNDNGNGACDNPWQNNQSLSNLVLGYSGGNQRYYYKGPGQAPNYACTRFLISALSSSIANITDDDISDGQAAYSCCQSRSQSTMCIENVDIFSLSIPTSFSKLNNAYEHKFCKRGSRCEVGSVWYNIYGSKKVSNYTCAVSYSLCPYNHLLGGGTEVASYNSDGTVSNYCQYLKHCIKNPVYPYVSSSSLSGAYISSSCQDLKGDSQNVYSYQIFSDSQRQFSAPLAQCFKETMENLFLNQAGYTACTDSNEEPVGGVCKSGYAQKEGQSLTSKSFFVTVQDNLRLAIKMVMTLAITFLGVNILIGGRIMARKDIMMFIIKLGLVSYFALGDAWQTFFFNGIYNGSVDIANLVMQPNEQKNANQLDGCQFPRYNYARTESDNYNYPAYPPGKSYLRIWDTLDCKIAFALGFGPDVTIPNLILMILGGFLTGALGIIFLIAVLIFAFYMIALTIRALHIFLLSSMSIIIMLYISPITITLSLFKRTEKIFKQWLNNLLGFALQPVILFAYLGILITLFDKIILGDATFSGDGLDSAKQIVCSGEASNTSVYCIFKINSLNTYNGLEAIGIGLPVLADLNSSKINTLIISAFIMFVFTKFLDTISYVASSLVGGSELSSGSIGTKQIAKNTYGVLRGIQKRGMGFAKKFGGKAVKAGAGKVQSVARAVGTRNSMLNIGGNAPNNAGNRNNNNNNNGVVPHFNNNNGGGANDNN